MKALEYIKSWLERNKNSINLESALYEYHPYSETHFLKISPDSILADEKYELILSDFIYGFDTEFPLEGLCLLRNNSLTKLEKPVELIPQVLPAIAPVYHEPQLGVSIFKNMLLEPIRSFDWSSITSFNLKNTEPPLVEIDCWNFTFEVPVKLPTSFTENIVDAQIPSIKTEEFYSVDEEYQNNAA